MGLLKCTRINVACLHNIIRSLMSYFYASGLSSHPTFSYVGVLMFLDGPMDVVTLFRLLSLLVVFHLPLHSCTIGPKSKSSLKDKKSSKNAQKNNRGGDTDKLGPQQLTVEDVIAQSLMGVSDKDRKFANNVLGYVTPWNNKGYDHAKNLGAKFDLISPVWYQLKRLSGKVEFGG